MSFAEPLKEKEGPQKKALNKFDLADDKYLNEHRTSKIKENP